MSKEEIDIIDVMEYMDYKRVEEINLSENYYNNEGLINNLKDSINKSFKYGFEEGKKLGKSNEHMEMVKKMAVRLIMKTDFSDSKIVEIINEDILKEEFVKGYRKHIENSILQDKKSDIMATYRWIKKNKTYEDISEILDISNETYNEIKQCIFNGLQESEVLQKLGLNI